MAVFSCFIWLQDNLVQLQIYVIASLLFNLLAFLGMAISYSFIVKMLCDPEQPNRSEDKAIILKMATLIGTEMLCWFPTLFFGKLNDSFHGRILPFTRIIQN